MKQTTLMLLLAACALLTGAWLIGGRLDPACQKETPLRGGWLLVDCNDPPPDDGGGE